MAGVAQAWNTAQPSATTWEALRDALEVDATLGAYVRPGTWGDAGPIRIFPDESDFGALQTQLSLWAELASPLIVDADPAELTPRVVELLIHPQLLAIAQDPRGMLGAPLNPPLQPSAFSKPLQAAGSRAVLLLNPMDTPSLVEASWADLGIAPNPSVVRDVWDQRALPVAESGLSELLATFGARLLEVSGEELPPAQGDVYLSDLPFSYAANSFGPVERDTSNGEIPRGDGRRINLNGVGFDRGLGVHTGSDVRIRLGTACGEFAASIGLDAECVDSERAARFFVFGDGALLYQSPRFRDDSAPASIRVDVSGRDELRLFVSSAGELPLNDFSCGHAAWAEARVTCLAPAP